MKMVNVGNSITLNNLRVKQGQSLDIKIKMTNRRIREWYNYWHGNVYVAFSGGKDSTVLLNLVRSIYPSVPGVFVDTGLEYPELRKFVQTYDNITWLKPSKNFRTVLSDYGYPIISKRVARQVEDLRRPVGSNPNTRNLRLTGYNQRGVYCPSHKLPKKWLRLVDAPFKISAKCCDVMKKNPMKMYQRKTKSYPFVGMMASDSDMRDKFFSVNQCNMYDSKSPMSNPMAFWNEQDILNYIRNNSLPICSVYGEIEECSGQLKLTGEPRTGCIFCMFGVHLEGEPNRFQRLKKTHPRVWDYCINQLNLKEPLDYIGVKWE